MNLDCIEEVEQLIERRIWKHKHVLGKSLDQAEHAALGIKPSVSAELLLEGLKRLNYSRDSKGVIALGTVKSTDD